MRMAKEDTARGLISGTISSALGQDEEQYTFLDKLYSTNTLYRHIFPASQALGTDEKDMLLKYDELSRELASEDDKDDVAKKES